MSEVENGSFTYVNLLKPLVAACLGLALFYFFSSKRQQSEQLKSKAATGEIAKADGHPPAQSSHVPKRHGAAGKQKGTATEKANQQRHHLDLVTLKGHGDAVTGVAFTSNGRGLATACADQVIRVFKLEDAFSKSFKLLRLSLPAGKTPTGVAFGLGASQLVVSFEDIGGAGLCLFAAGGGKAAADAKAQGKLPLPEIKWDKQHTHGSKNIITLAGAPATYGNGNGSVIVATCSEGTDIKLWKAADGTHLGTVDTNQLKNTMATLSADGRFLAAAAFTADVKVWELVSGKDGLIETVEKVMQLKGHKSAVTWLCFSWDSKSIITASKDGTIRVWNIDVRYHLDEDPKCLKEFPIPLRDSKGSPLLYERLALSPDNKILAASNGHSLQWLSMETGAVLDTAEKAHDGKILCLVWSPEPVPTERGKAAILATAGHDKKVKLWFPPTP